jgi:hypothetical protein
MEKSIDSAVAATLLCIAITAFAQTLTFESYYPHRAEKTLIFDYSSIGEGAVDWTYRGTLTRTPSDPATRQDTAYQTITHTTEGLPEFFPKEWQTLHRETKDGLYTGQLGQDGQMEEHLEFPVRAQAGEAWSTPSEFWDTETPRPVARVETDAGTFENCVRVDRYRKDPAQDQTLTNATTYCPDVGPVHDVVELRLPNFHSITELKLKGIQP